MEREAILLPVILSRSTCCCHVVVFVFYSTIDDLAHYQRAFCVLESLPHPGYSMTVWQSQDSPIPLGPIAPQR